MRSECGAGTGSCGSDRLLPSNRKTDSSLLAGHVLAAMQALNIPEPTEPTTVTHRFCVCPRSLGALSCSTVVGAMQDLGTVQLVVCASTVHVADNADQYIQHRIDSSLVEIVRAMNAEGVAMLTSVLTLPRSDNFGDTEVSMSLKSVLEYYDVSVLGSGCVRRPAVGWLYCLACV